MRRYENDGAALLNFTVHVVPTTGIDYFALWADDVDDDGDIDLITGNGPTGPSSSQVAWHENKGGSPTTFVEHELSRNTNWPHTISTADLDGDKDLDIAVGSLRYNSDGLIVWYENNGATDPDFSEHIISSGSDTRSVSASDVDGDGNFDVFAAQFLLDASNDRDGKFVWYENEGGIAPGFDEYLIAVSLDLTPPLSIYAENVFAGDFDNNCRIDVLERESGGPSSRLLWYENLSEGVRKEYVDLTQLHDINGNSYPETATLRRLANGHPQVAIKDSSNGKPVNFVGFFGPRWESMGVDTLDANGDHMPDLAVLAIRETDGRIEVQVSDARTDTFIKQIEFFGPNWEARNLTVDDADYNGMPYISLLAVNKTSGNVSVEIRDAATGNKSSGYGS